MAEARGSEALIARLSEQDGISSDFAADLVAALDGAQPLELTRRGAGVQFVFAGRADDDEWSGAATARVLGLGRKHGVRFDLDWFPFGIIEPDLLLGRIRLAENLAGPR